MEIRETWVHGLRRRFRTQPPIPRPVARLSPKNPLTTLPLLRRMCNLPRQRSVSRKSPRVKRAAHVLLVSISMTLNISWSTKFIIFLDAAGNDDGESQARRRADPQPTPPPSQTSSSTTPRRARRQQSAHTESNRTTDDERGRAHDDRQRRGNPPPPTPPHRTQPTTPHREHRQQQARHEPTRATEGTTPQPTLERVESRHMINHYRVCLERRLANAAVRGEQLRYDGCTYRNVRSLTGEIYDTIDASQWFEGQHHDSKARVPSLGRTADLYLASHGYDNDAIQAIYDIVAMHIDDRHEVVRVLAEESGMSLREAIFLVMCITPPMVLTTYCPDDM